MGFNTQSTERQRFRSFTERYLIARAETFRKGKEEEDAWNTMLQAQSIYQRLNSFSAKFEENPEQGVAGAAPNQLFVPTTPTGEQVQALLQAIHHEPDQNVRTSLIKSFRRLVGR